MLTKFYSRRQISGGAAATLAAALIGNIHRFWAASTPWIQNVATLEFSPRHDDLFQSYLNSGWQSNFLQVSEFWHKLHRQEMLHFQKLGCLLGRTRRVDVKSRKVVFTTYWASEKHFQAFYSRMGFAEIEDRMAKNGLRLTYRSREISAAHAFFNLNTEQWKSKDV